jgi:hypothetical protein
MSRDLSCRPHELLKLRIKDIRFKTSGNFQHAEVLVNGKTGSRPIPLINSIPYVKDFLDHEHPQPSNPNAILRPGICHKTQSRSQSNRCKRNAIQDTGRPTSEKILPQDTTCIQW